MDKFNKNVAGLRGFAASAIVLMHGYVGPRENGWFVVSGWWFPKAINFLINSLECSVEFFFMISGYLIVATLIRKKNIRVFLLDRFLRIYPVFFVFNTLVFIGLLVGNVRLTNLQGYPLLPSYFISSLLLSGFFVVPSALPVDWSLSYEWLFYFFAAVIFGNLLFSSRFKLGRVAIAFVGVVAIVIFSAYWPRFIFFLTGVIVYRYGRGWAHASSLVRDFGVFLFLPVLILEEVSLRHAHGLAIYAYCAAAFALSIPCFVSIVFGSRWTTAPLRARYVQWLGMISYSLYLVHLLLEFGLKRILHPWLAGRHAVIQVLVLEVALFAASTATAYLSYLLIEEKFTNTLKRVL